MAFSAELLRCHVVRFPFLLLSSSSLSILGRHFGVCLTSLPCQKGSLLRLIDILPELLLSIAEVCHAVLASGRQIDPIEWRTSFIKRRRRRPTCQFHGKLKEDPSVRLSAGQAINLGGREEDLVLVSSTLSLTALHSARSRSNLCTQFYCPDKSDEDSADWVRLSTLGRSPSGSAARPAHRGQNVTSNEKVAQLRRTRKLPFSPLPFHPFLP